MIKEFVKQNDKYHIVIRNNHYGSSVDVIMKLVDTTWRDFGAIEHKDIKIVHYGGRRYKGTFGIEFETNQKPPDDYTQIAQLEYTL